MSPCLALFFLSLFSSFLSHLTSFTPCNDPALLHRWPDHHPKGQPGGMDPSEIKWERDNDGV